MATKNEASLAAESAARRTGRALVAILLGFAAIKFPQILAAVTTAQVVAEQVPAAQAQGEALISTFEALGGGVIASALMGLGKYARATGKRIASFLPF